MFEQLHMEDNVALTGTKVVVYLQKGWIFMKYFLCHYFVKSYNSIFLNYGIDILNYGTSPYLCVGEMEK